MARVGEIIRVLRIKRGLSQSQLAAEMNLKRSAIGNYEQGIREPDLDTIEALADYFDVSVADLMGRKEPMDEAELNEIREDFRRNPELRSIHDLSRKASKEQLKQIESFIRFLRSSNDYEGDDTP